MKKFLLVLAFSCAVVTAVSGKGERRLRVSCVGNSITFGTGTAEPGVESYPAQLQRLLGDGYEVGNFGKPGATLLRRAFRPYDVQEEFGRAMDFHGDIAVIHLGINDTDPRAWPNYGDDFVRDYMALIDSLRRSNPRVRVIVARLTPLSDRHHRFLSGTRDWREEIQQRIELVARLCGCELVDFHDVLYHRPELMPDGIHPNGEGYALLARAVYSAITGDYGGLSLPSCYTDDMVLPRERAFRICGTANAGEEVRLTIGGQRHKVRAGRDGRWSAEVEALPSGGPYTLTVSTRQRRIELSNILAGELWICSGQSNMAFQLRQCTTGGEDIPRAGNSQIRLLNLEARWPTNPVEWDAGALDSVNALEYFTRPVWQACTPESVQRFSAVGYYFARELQDSLGCPVGIIGNAVGGSGTEAWIDRGTLEHDFPEILRDWTRNDFIQDWVRGRAEQNMGAGRHAPLQRHPYQPCYLYESGVWPLRHLPIDGVLWYQGESNAHNWQAHERLFRLLVRSWRRTWDEPELPFYYVQLSSLDRPSWPSFRDAQRRLMQLVPHTGMAVSSDHGDSLDVHPRHKLPVGRRLAAWALHDTYGFTRVVPSGPLFRSAEFRGSEAWISFDHADSLHASDGQPLRTFELAEHEGLFYPAQAVVEDGRVRVSSPHVRRPRIVRYGWQPFTRANLVNGAGLPASTFRSDDAP